MGGTLTNGTDTTKSFPIAQDTYGFSLHYYKNDYEAIGYTPQATSVLGALTINAAPLFNGNIAAMAVNIPRLGNTKAYNYHYDQLNRIVAMDMYNGLNVNNGTFTSISVNDYGERISYDPNGNILTYDRHGDAARLSMDSLSYFYAANTNRLHNVTDAAADAAPGDYSKYNDIKQGQADDNYGYDEIGNLVADNAESITNVTWNVYGKIANITKSDSLIKYVYDAAGNRVMKQTATDTTIYVRDASGNVLSVYSKPTSGVLVQSETHLYGSSRIGIATLHSIPDTSEVLSGGFKDGIKRIFVRGEKLFELSNHLGNVLVTLNDRKIAVSAGGSDIDYYSADASSVNDYYPGGMGMPGREFTPGNGYRYSINGQEKTPEIAPNTTTAEFWQYDARIMKRWNVDPLAHKFPWQSGYTAFDNNPINKIDPTGLAASPIYDQSGNLLGTDDQGLQGAAIFMDKKDFQQNMSHEDALKKNLGSGALRDDKAIANFAASYTTLKNRPDYDGEMTYTELFKWGREQGDKPVFLNAAKIDLGDLYVSDFAGVGKGRFVNTTTTHNTPLDTYGPWGKNYMTLRSADGKVKLSNDRFDYEQHSLSKARQEGAGTWGYEFFIRHPSISILQTVHGVDDKFGFDLKPYGYGQLKPEPSFLMKVFNFIGEGASAIKN